VRSPEPSPFGHDVSGLAHEVTSLRRATRSDVPGRVGMGNPTPLAGSCCSLDAARRSSGFAAGKATAAFRTSSVSSVFKEPRLHGAYHRLLTRSPPPFLPTRKRAGFPVAISVNTRIGTSLTRRQRCPPQVACLLHAAQTGQGDAGCAVPPPPKAPTQRRTSPCMRANAGAAKGARLWLGAQGDVQPPNRGLH